MTKPARILSAHLLFAAAALVLGCAHQAPVTPRAQRQNRVTIHEEGTPIPAGTRFAIQVNNEPPIIQVADGRGGPPILYHGHELNPDRLKSVIILKGKEARERFGDQTLYAAILIETK
jgi:hypothetical protein